MENDSQPAEQVLVSLDVVWHGTAGKYDARMSELSLEGCFIDSMGQEILGETISFKVRLTSGHWISLQGEVIYSEYPIGFEVRFVNLTPDNRRLITQVVAAHGGRQAQQIIAREAQEKASTAATTAAAESDPRRVLVADDDPMTLEILKAIVGSEDYKVVAVSDGREAFRALQYDDQFSAVIFDMMMPHLDGLDLINYMKTDPRLKRIPIGMITAEQDPKIWDDSIAAGASVFLPKPFTPPQIKMMLKILVSKVID